MRTQEVIICRECGEEDCSVEELFEKEKISMEEYAQRHPRQFPPNFAAEARTARRFVITCQNCGEQHEFTERLEPLPDFKFIQELLKKYDL
jgi:hypothetical protein